LDPGRGRTKRGYLWSYVRDDRGSGGRDPPAVWFAYYLIAREAIRNIICATSQGCCKPTLTPAFDPIASARRARHLQANRARRVLCLVTARRHFHDLHVAVGIARRLEALQRIAELLSHRT